jgi:4-amino-4-deoxychorismate lyase
VTPARIVVVPGKGVVPADTPILTADDLGVLRGDGIFETMHVRGGRPWLLDEHLDRMARSAARMGLALPPRAELVDLAEQACAEWPPGVEGALRLVCTRGPESGATGQDPRPGGAAPVTLFATLSPVGQASIEARRVGLAVVTATLGFAAGARTDAPWLLGGVKSLSYAVNMASQRWAAEQGADDVLWVSSDGYALEAPTATLVWLSGGTLCTVPAGTTGILPGTTARWLLDHADRLGWTAAERMVTPAELARVDGAWLVSSVRGVAAIRTLDGAALAADPERTARITALLGY